MGLFIQILNSAAGRRLAWDARAPKLMAPNVIHADHRFETRSRDRQVVLEFKSKLRQTEDLLGKLGFSLREITNDPS